MRNFNSLFDLHSFFLDCTFYRVSGSLACTYFHFFSASCLLWRGDKLRVTVGRLCRRWTNSNRCQMQILFPRSCPLSLPFSPSARQHSSHYLSIIMQSSLLGSNRSVRLESILSDCSMFAEDWTSYLWQALSICRRCLGCLKVPTNLDHNQSNQSLLMPHVVQARLEWFREITAIADEIYIHNRGLSEACRS